MLGIILWYNAEKSVGLIWCEDQGPLAYIGPDVSKPEGVDDLKRGSQIWFEYDETNGFRTVRRIEAVSVVMCGTDPAKVLAKYDPPSTRSVLRVVA
ncbi:hypothetical protein MUY35_07510 [Aliiroseovarius sp. S1339]|uniref:hypothetical protein n=1 Tax=Aliiroseovarius sp. S1339 TaxID=2936990 RepID=UPI0020BD48A7|nr:hypothetical protein [Aliiroseovarius sp. S1339]MCK8463694.1 hypothetical protein [Aliiroseovarius sp. S1339]